MKKTKLKAYVVSTYPYIYMYSRVINSINTDVWI